MQLEETAGAGAAQASEHAAQGVEKRYKALGRVKQFRSAVVEARLADALP